MVACRSAVPVGQLYAAGIEQVHLAGRGCVYRDTGRNAGAERQTLVVERAGIGEDAVEAGRKRPSGADGHIKRAVQPQVAVDDRVIVVRASDGVGLAKIIGKRRAAVERQVAGYSQGSRRIASAAGRKRAAIFHDHRAASGTVTAQRRTTGHSDLATAALDAVDDERAGIDVGRADVAVVGREDRGPRSHLGDAAAARDEPGNGKRSVAVERQRAVVDDVAAASVPDVPPLPIRSFAGTDRGAGAVVVVAGQCQQAGLRLAEGFEIRDLRGVERARRRVIHLQRIDACASVHDAGQGGGAIQDERIAAAAQIEHAGAGVERAGQVDDIAAAAEIAIAPQQAAGTDVDCAGAIVAGDRDRRRARRLHRAGYRQRRHRRAELVERQCRGRQCAAGIDLQRAGADLSRADRIVRRGECGRAGAAAGSACPRR